MQRKELAVTVCAVDIIPAVESRIAEKIGPKGFGIWFKNATQFTLADHYLRISVPNRFVGEWI